MSRPGVAVPVCDRPAFRGVERSRVLEWLEGAPDVPVRILCGPVGTGKTFVARQYAARAADCAYVRVSSGMGAERLLAAIAGADAEEVILDEFDRVDAAVCAELVDAVVAGEISRRLVLVGRSRRRMGADGLVARGYARVCNDELLAFSAADVEQLAATHGVEVSDEDIAQLLLDTDGWALAVEWLIRDAAEARRSLRDAFAHWQPRNGHLLLEFVEREAFEHGAAYESFMRALRAGWRSDDPETARLDALGLPIIRTRSGLRPYRILARLAAPSEPVAVERPTVVTAPVMAVNLFGRFRCQIAGRAVVFPRRRDQQVFAFVALEPECRTTRERLLEAFWPGINHTVAAQGLRTTLSRIRRAIAEAAPAVSPERYFETAGEVRINVRAVAVDAQRFVDRVEQGRIDDARGHVEGAKHHYRVAQRIYADRALASEASEPCIERRAEHLESLYIEVLTRITELHAATGDFDTARDAARALLMCNTEESRRRALSSIATPCVALA